MTSAASDRPGSDRPGSDRPGPGEPLRGEVLPPGAPTDSTPIDFTPVDFMKRGPGPGSGPGNADGPGVTSSAGDVGAFEQGTAFSRWALARYLVGQAILAAVSQTMFVVAAVLVILAVVCQVFTHLTVLTVLLVLFALGVLFVRWVLKTLLARFTDARRYSPVAARLGALVDDTEGDVMKELRRLGLPSHMLTMPLLAVRMVGKRRYDTIERLRGFDTARVVPSARIDELHMLLRTGEVAP